MILRILALLLSLPALAAAGLQLAGSGVPGSAALARFQKLAQEALAGAAGDAGRAALERIDSPLAGILAAGLGLFLLAVALRPRRRRGEGEPPAAGEPPPVERRALRRLERQAAALARKGQRREAAELCAGAGLLDRAVEYFEAAEEYVRAAELRHDQNRFAEAAELYIRAGQYETAGTIFSAQNEFARAADCYQKAGRMSVAAEMFEKAGQFGQAARCYAQCEFHRHAARAFVKARDWPQAAAALEQVVIEESRRIGAGQDPAKEIELRKLVLQAGKLYEQAGDLEAAQRVLERGECLAAAAEVAQARGELELAADLFQRAREPLRAAEVLRRAGEDKAAAQILGEYHREQGDIEQAARLLVEAGDYLSAGDLYRQLEDWKLAGECFDRQGDGLQAAEMFRLAGDLARAADCFERVECFEQAAECAAHLGDPVREAEYLSRAGLLLGAGELYAQEGLDDLAIKVLQQVKPDSADFPGASGLLGEIFASKGKHGLALTKLRQAVGEAVLDADNIHLFYRMATVHEAAGEVREAADLYERILTADYHYQDVEARLEATRALAESLPPAGESSGGSQDTLPPTRGQPGRYQILGELGRGGMGIVYKAQDTVLDRPVAFKVLPDALRDNPQALKNFLREAKSAAKLNHPNVVTVYDAGEQDGRYYIAMEYVDGTTLKEILRRRGVISTTGVLHVLVQMCEALAYAHSQKVVHRDIKTANAMWTRDKKAKIMDFGLAKVVEEVRNHTTLVSGTPYYMSPEQTLGKNVDHRTDLYSLGVTIFEMSTGSLPFKEGNVPYHHVHTPPPDPRQVNPEVPAELAAIINRCLQKDPAARFSSAGEILEEVRRFMAG